MSRKDKEPTRAQLSSRLSYQQHVPAFLQKLQNKFSGISNDDDDYEDEYEDEFGRQRRGGGHGSGGYDDNGEWEHINDGSGRPPIPRRPRPPIPERPDGELGSEDEEGGDEKPQVVVLKEGKHLTEWEAENVRRKEKGLAPLPDPSEEKSAAVETVNSEASSKAGKGKSKASAPSLSFSSSNAKSSPSKSFKRKVLGGDDSEEEDSRGSRGGKATGKEKEKKEPPKKKSKKSSKTLLSFGDDA